MPHHTHSIDRWDDATGSNLYEHLAVLGPNLPPPGSDEQKFGAKQQIQPGEQTDKEAEHGALQPQHSGESAIMKTLLKTLTYVGSDALNGLLLPVIAVFAMAGLANAADGDPAGGGVWVAIILGLYFLPSIVAKCRGHRSFGGIFVVNLFLGWTFIGWVGAFAWACSYPGDKAKPTTVSELVMGKSAAPKPRDFGQRGPAEEAAYQARQNRTAQDKWREFMTPANNQG